MSVRRFHDHVPPAPLAVGQHEARWKYLLGENDCGHCHTDACLCAAVRRCHLVAPYKKALKNSLKIVAGKGWRRFWYDLHVAGGMYTLIFLLAMALTGLTWSFSWYRTGFYKVFGVETMQGGGGHGAQAQTAAHGGDRAQGRSGGENRERKPFSPLQTGRRFTKN